MAINVKNWSRLSSLLDSVLELPEEDRLPWLDKLELDDADLKKQLHELLTSDQGTGSPLYKPPDFYGVLKEEMPRLQMDVELESGRLIGAYQLLRELGRGGMGVVWLAVRMDGTFKREVALKFPYAGPRQRQLAERLMRERDILAGLQHANIARMYDALTTSTGQPFLVLEYINGVPIHQYCDEQKLDIQARLTLFQQVLSAVRYAHSHFVVHRDIKPSNILITSDGAVHLLDFGIATLITEGEATETPLTQFDGHVLTPEYASPEQISKIPVTTASDVYALGVVLYELLTGASPYPYSREQRAQLEQAISNAEVVTPSRAPISKTAATHRNTQVPTLRRTLHGELDTLLLKALKKDIDDRYASVDTFYEDIRRYLAHQPIHAQPDSEWYRIKKFARRNRTAVASVVAIMLALLIGTGIALWQARLANQQRDRAIALATRSEAVTGFMRLMVTEIADVDKPITMQTLLARAEDAVSKSFSGNADQQAAVLEVLGSYYLDLNQSELANESFVKALALTKNSRDYEFKALLNCSIGRVFDQLGNVDKAREYISAGLDMSRDYALVHTQCLQARAYLAFAVDDMNAALRDIHSAQETLRNAGLHPSDLVLALLLQEADVELELGRTSDAERDYATTYEQLTKLGYGEQSLAMVVQNNWSGADSYAGNPRGALAHLDKAREIAHKRGVNRNGDSAFSANYGAELRNLGRYQEALHEYQLGIESAQRNGRVSDIAAGKQGMARTLLALGRITEAEQILHQLLSMVGKEIPPDSFDAERVSLLSGLVALAKRHYVDAADIFSHNIDFLSAHNQLGAAYAYNLKLRGDAYLGQNNLTAAWADAIKSYDILHSLQGTLRYSSYAGETALLLAKIESKRNNADEERKWSTIAYQQLQGSLGDTHPTTIEAKQLLDSAQAVH